MDLTGKMLAGRYEMLEEIGKGGMALVYKAQDHFLNRFVAVKVLKEELRDDKEFVTRFNTEAQAAARISNPHVVSIYDVGFENGLYYIVMEYIEGITLKEYISEKKPLGWKSAAIFAAQICEGLDAAHQQSVIHRDIKPQNIIVTADNTLKVTDFGIARATSQATTTNSSSTIGTVHYLSPEQARGGFTNERTDIYSLGVVLYEMLTGRLPFDDSTAVAIAIKHIQEKPVLPRILNNDIPESMEHIVMKAMNKEQDLRYSSASELLADLRTVISNPYVELGNEDMDMTRKREPIGPEEIKNYEKKRADKTRGYDDYSDRVDKEMEESKLRSLDRKRAIREQKKKERRITIAAILAAVLLIGVLAFAFSAISGGNVMTVFTGGEKIEIPNLIDMKLTDAQRQYRTEGFSIVKKGEKVSDKEPGVILEQDPPANSDVTKKDDIIIGVIVSAGTQSKPVSKYTDMKVDDAKKKIEIDGFKVNVVEQESSSVEKGKVISQIPEAGSVSTEGALITIYVSKGEPQNNQPEVENNRPSTNEPTPSEPSGGNQGSEGNQSGTGQTPENPSTGAENPSTQGGNTSSGNEGSAPTEAPSISN